MTNGAEPGRTSYVGELGGVGVLCPRGGEARRVSSEVQWANQRDYSCSGVIPGGLEVQGLGKGPPGVLTGWTA